GPARNLPYAHRHHLRQQPGRVGGAMSERSPRSSRGFPSSRRGVTLVEILTVSALSLVLLTGLVATGLSAGGEYSRGAAKMQADNQASLALQKMTRELRGGIRATINSSSDLSV